MLSGFRSSPVVFPPHWKWRRDGVTCSGAAGEATPRAGRGKANGATPQQARNAFAAAVTTLRAASAFCPVQIWVPDARAPGFAEECRRQCLLLAEADKLDPEVDAWLDASNRALADDLDRQGL